MSILGGEDHRSVEPLRGVDPVSGLQLEGFIRKFEGRDDGSVWLTSVNQRSLSTQPPVVLPGQPAWKHAVADFETGGLHDFPRGPGATTVHMRLNPRGVHFHLAKVFDISIGDFLLVATTSSGLLDPKASVALQSELALGASTPLSHWLQQVTAASPMIQQEAVCVGFCESKS